MAVASPIPARIPAVAATVTLVLLVLTAALVHRDLSLCGGRLVYPLDDTYIHMTMARNFATHGSWGITPGRFEPASSSPLWTLMLAALVRLFGAGDALPLALGLLCMVALVAVLEAVFHRFIPRSVVRGAVLVVLLLAIGLPALALTGMEPVLHMLLTLPLAWTVVRRLSETDPSPGRGGPLIFSLAALAVLARFESLFLIGTLAVASLVRRRPATAAALAAGAGAALAAYMAFALPQGGPWLPNSVLLNAPLAHPDVADPWLRFLRRIPDEILRNRNEHVPALLIAAGWMLLPRRGVRSANASAARLLLGVLVPALLLHVQFAQVDSFFRRYEAYLVMLGLVGLVAAVASRLGGPPDALAGRLPRRLAPAITALGMLALALAFVVRGVQLVRWTPQAVQNIFEQQIQMSRFTHEHLRGRTIAINDLGAVGYYGGARILDLYGLATMPVAKAILEKRYDTAFIERICAAEGVEVALIYESWFVGAMSPPATWARVARWTIRNNVIAGDDAVTIFAARREAADRIREAARVFARTLPPRVIVEELP